METRQYEELFLTESREYVSAINQQLLLLEQGGEVGEPVRAIFRAVHTLKGMSATMGYDAVAELAHELESALDGVRSGERALDPELVDLLFRGTDLLEMSVSAAIEGRDGSVATAYVVSRLRALTGAAPRARANFAPTRAVAVPQGKGRLVTIGPGSML